MKTDVGLGQQLAVGDASGAAVEALGLLPGGSLPIVISGDALEDWLAQPDDVKVEDDSK